MLTKKHQVAYTTKNSYETLNNLTEKTKNVWFVLHGMGYLSRYFLKYFSLLDDDENYIICPQAPSKYYLKDDFKHVGASWLTKEDTLQEINNVLTYLDGVRNAENISDNTNIILFGFSQGVSMVMRWLTSRKMKCAKVILYAGSIPKEITQEAVRFIDYDRTQIKIIYGDTDIYLTPERLKEEYQKINLLFRGKAEIITFKGGHEVKPELLMDIIS